VTEEQLIVLGFLVAAFAVGWLARALIGRRDRRDRTGVEAPATVSREHLERAVEATRTELDLAIRSHVAAVALSLRARDGAPEQAAEPDLLTEEVTEALQDDAANECMLSVMDADRDSALSERELDLTDWGFAYGVAWARARERGSGEAEDVVAREALRVAERVFRAYAAEAEWASEASSEGNGRGRWPRTGR
jgi:hypothetical protein